MAYDSNGAWKPEDDSVATRVSRLTGADSPLMQRAQGNAMKAANRRGLINSTMAARAGAAAAIDAATPIASQDAAQTAQKNLQAQTDWAARDRQLLGGTQASDLSRQEAGQQGNLAVQQAGYSRDLQMLQGNQALSLADRNAAAERDLQQLRGTQSLDLQTLTGRQQSDLSGQDYRQQSGLTAQQAAAQRDLQLLSGTQSIDLARQNATSQRDLQLLSGTQASDLQAQSGRQAADLARQNADAERSLQQLRGQQEAATNANALGAQARTQFSASATAMYNSFNDSVATIMANTNLSADARSAALASLQASTNAGLTLITQAAGVSLDWGTAPAATGSSGLPSGIGSAQLAGVPATQAAAPIAYRRAGDLR
jgi:hypothetical protein